MLAEQSTARYGVKVGFILVPGFALTSFSLAVEALSVANSLLGESYYQITLVHSGDRPNAKSVLSSNSVPVLTPTNYSQIADCNWLFICAYKQVVRFDEKKLFSFLRRQHHRGVTLVGLSCASFILAKAGLLHAKRCTLANELLHVFTELYPDIRVQENIFTQQQNILTCAGGIATLDMLFYLIGKQHGQDLVNKIAQQFLQDKIRSEAQTQQATRLLHYRMKSPLLGDAIEIMEANIEEPWQIHKIAKQVGTTTRTLENLFKHHESTSPAKYYVAMRLAKARKLVVETQLPIVQIAQATGFKSQSYFSRCFRERFGYPANSLRNTRTSQN